MEYVIIAVGLVLIVVTYIVFFKNSKDSTKESDSNKAPYKIESPAKVDPVVKPVAKPAVAKKHTITDVDKLKSPELKIIKNTSSVKKPASKSSTSKTTANKVTSRTRRKPNVAKS